MELEVWINHLLTTITLNLSVVLFSILYFSIDITGMVRKFRFDLACFKYLIFWQGISISKSEFEQGKNISDNLDLQDNICIFEGFEKVIRILFGWAKNKKRQHIVSRQTQQKFSNVVC